MWNLSPSLYEAACTPSPILMVNMAALMGPKISSTLPTCTQHAGPLDGGDASPMLLAFMGQDPRAIVATAAPASCIRGGSLPGLVQYRVLRPGGHLGLVLEEDGGVEVRDFFIRQLADGFTLANVRENANLHTHSRS